ncbi:MAG: cysteine desulfurase [Treponema sp.]|nr:cysteine desulfurase [Treponema sp.]
MDFSKYFDWAATTPSDEEILQDSLREACANFANPSANHSEGKKARDIFEKARAECASAIGVKAEEVYFTSGGTESDQIPLLALLNREPDSEGRRGKILISSIEHPAIREQAHALKKVGFTVESINPDNSGFINPDAVAAKITPDTVYVTVMAVNNETGCVQDIYAISDAITRASKGKRRPHFHVDCVQAAGKIPLDLNYPGIDSAALSAHKLRGPRGIGILVLRRPIKPFLLGGGQEKSVRSGTENLFGALAFSKCLSKYFIKKNEKKADEQQKSFDFVTKLNSIRDCTLIPECRTDKDNLDKFSPYVVQAAFKGIPGNVMVRALDSKGFSISTGSACSAKKQSRPILSAMGVRGDLQETAVRFSFGRETSEQDLDALFNAVLEVCKDFSLEI